MVVIDAHQHFWDPETAYYPWMTDEVAPIRRPFTPVDLAPLLRCSGVDGTVLVQTRSSLSETYQFLEIAAQTDFVKGVVGWVDLTRPGVDEALSGLKRAVGGEFLAGIRHQVHDEADPWWLSRADVRAGLASVSRSGLAYDLLVRPRELPAALDAVQRFPGLRFVIDHIAKPDIRNKALQPWLDRMKPIARHRENVWCKLSGILTEADWQSWTVEGIKPYFDAALELFGPERCMFGSDWPVCTLAADYLTVKQLLESLIRQLPEHEISRIMGANAVEAYRLNV